MRRPIYRQHHVDSDGISRHLADGKQRYSRDVGEKDEAAFNAGKLVMELLRADLRPSRILTRKAIENAIASVAATGGSTNAVLHLLAIAREAGVELTIDDFDRISERTPLIADLKPGGRFVANDLYKAGGIQLVAKRLIEAGLIHGDTITVTGKTIAEAAQMTKETPGQEVVRPMAIRSSRPAAWLFSKVIWRRKAAWSKSQVMSA